AKYVPGTVEHSNEQEQYLQKVRNVTAKRVEQFSDVFDALSKSFSTPETTEGEGEETKRETDYFLSKVTESTCQRCFMKLRCLKNVFVMTYSLMESLKEDVSDVKELNRSLM